MLSKNVQSVLRDALMEVQRRKHDLLTVEHVLYAASRSSASRSILESAGTMIGLLRDQLDAFFRAQLDPINSSTKYEIAQTEGVQRVLERTISIARGNNRDEAEVADLLIAILEETDSYASYYLRKQGVRRSSILTSAAREESSQNNCDKCGGEEGSAKGDPLAEFTIDLTQRARDGKIDPLIGREKELDRAIEVLCRRRKNNPLFVGDPGVGKTALAEGLALRIAEGRIPEMFKDMRIFSLDMATALAGTRYRGDFESRLKSIVEALKKMPNAILFIDEIHTIVGAGATSGGSMDAANLLKPALANGDLRCIGSTTYEEFRNNLEKDRALARRFQKIDLHEPSIEDCFAILKGLESRYAEHHGVKYTPAVLKAMVELSSRHVRDRLLPDKAIDVMDECGAAVRLRACEKGEQDLPVMMADVERIVARMAGIPARTVSGRERSKLANLEKDLKRMVFGQDEAIELTVRAILRARAGLSPDRRPSGSFLFYGPTGVGKTEVAKSLAQLMGVDFLRFDMSEYMEKHAVSRLIGSPPGYVGFDQGGQLTEAVRKAPYSVVLFDEIEKAHPDIFNILLQVMDYGTLTDNTGRKTDFSNVIIILTSNAGAFDMVKSSIGFSSSAKGADASKALKAVENMFTPEFRNRLDALVPFSSLTEEMMLRIVDKFVNEVRSSLTEKKVELTLTDKARKWLASHGFDPSMGARPLRRLIRTELEDKLAYELLFGVLKKGGKAKLTVRDDHLHVTIGSSFNKASAPARKGPVLEGLMAE